MPVAGALADKGPIEMVQDDTFFACQNGRLKLRVTRAHEGRSFYRIISRLWRVSPKFLIQFRIAKELGSK
jgi:hypothetical protein